MRQMLFTLLLVLAAIAVARAQDPTKVDSNHYKVVLENDSVRVLRIHYAKGEKSVMHEHPAAVAVFLNDQTVRFHHPDGKSEDAPSKAGEAVFMPGGKHLPENIGDGPLDVILVELKSPAKP